MYRISLTVGDYSGDGHSHEDVIYLNCSVDVKGLEEAYNKSGIDVESQCDDYEDKSFNKAMAYMLLEKGKASEFITEFIKGELEFMFEDEVKEDEEDFDLYCTEIFAVFWLCAARIGNPELKIEIVSVNPPNINIGGYGLF